MIKKAFVVILFCCVTAVSSQQNPLKYALVIGNAEYPRVSDRLPNAINDTSDIGRALRELGYQVELKQNLKRLDMIRETDAFIARLRGNRNSEGFFWYAGHAMEIGGENLLLPLDVNLDSYSLIEATAFSLTNLTRQLDGVRNRVNVVVLDACRTPPGMGRSFGDASRSIKVIQNVPPDLLIIYSTAPGTVAYDGEGRNSPFTEAFLKHVRSAEPLTIMMGHVTSETMSLTGQRQRPYYNGSMGSENIYYSLNQAVAPTPAPAPQPAPAPRPAPVSTPAPQPAPAPAVVQPQSQPAPQPTPTSQPAAVLENFVRVEGGSFQMGSPTGGPKDERPVHTVTVKSFSIGKYEVTQKEYQEIMGKNPSNFKGDNLPVENVSWFDAVEYCNKLSMKEGLAPAYLGSGNSIICDWNANGYRLPTEAEWEYAAKGGNKDRLAYEYSGSTDVDAVAWYNNNSKRSTHSVGTKAPNSLGLYDMSGNVWEWCWDWYGNYSNRTQTDPLGASKGKLRIVRGGSWDNQAQIVRSAFRNYREPSYRSNALGFRIVLP